MLCPYFGLWNKSNARLSVCLAAHVPAKYNDEETSSDIANQASALNTASPGAADSSNLGAFAYCVEATESLNQVTTFFLQQRIDWQNKQDVVDWLARFKELDLRLVQYVTASGLPCRCNTMTDSRSKLEDFLATTVERLEHFGG